MAIPKFLTFTGADDNTDIAGMLELSSQYPIEWGILFSPKRHGTPRYPSVAKVHEFAEANCIGRNFKLRMSAHFCGAYARTILEGKFSLVEKLFEDVLLTFHRAQINTAGPVGVEAASALPAWARSWAKRPILQSRDAQCFPLWTEIDWLYDCSGGNAIATNEWPEEPTERLVGYAGGIGPDSISRVMAGIYGRAINYWLCMESGVRTDDRFDLEKCRAVCEAVYGKTPAKQLEAA
jgi:hypothetical protein